MDRCFIYISVVSSWVVLSMSGFSLHPFWLFYIFSCFFGLVLISISFWTILSWKLNFLLYFTTEWSFFLFSCCKQHAVFYLLKTASTLFKLIVVVLLGISILFSIFSIHVEFPHFPPYLSIYMFPFDAIS